MNSTRTIKIAIADDHEMVRYGFKTFIGHQNSANFKFIAEASNGIELVEKVKKYRPDIVVTDIRMPEMDGIQACRIIKEKYPTTKVIVFSLLEEENIVLEMLYAGANGYVVKGTDKEEILEAIITVSEGLPYYCSTISKKLFGALGCSNSNKQKTKRIQLSLKEIKVIGLICKQLTTKQIAATLQLSTRSIDDHRYNIQEKTGAKNVVGIVLHALINGIVKLSEL